MERKIVKPRNEFDVAAGAPDGRWRTLRRALVGVCTVPALVLLPVHSAHADAPTNDFFEDAKVIDALPYTDYVNTFEATAEPQNLDCEANNNSVWYSFIPDTEGNVTVDTFGSDFDTMLCVYVGTPSADTQIAFSDDTADNLQSEVRFHALEGTLYFILAGSIFPDGGNLVLNAQAGPPPLQIDVAVAESGGVDSKTGRATVSGTVTCSRPVFIDLPGLLRQKTLSHLSIDGEFETFVEECDGQMDWSVVVESPEGFYKGGQAVVEGAACGGDDLESVCTDFIAVIALKSNKK